MPALKVLFVHGVSGHEPGGTWQPEWQRALEQALGQPVSAEFCHLDDPFKHLQLNAVQTAEAVALLLRSWLRPQPKAFGFGRGGEWGDGLLEGVYERTAGMVAEWVRSEAVRRESRELLRRRIEQTRPQLVFAHSLGSLVAYDCFSHTDTRACGDGLHLVVFGSQLGHPALRDSFGGKLQMPPTLARLTQLYNEHDRVFTEAMPLSDQRFTRIDTPFRDFPLHHDAGQYLGFAKAVPGRWGDWFEAAAAPRARALRRAAVAAEAPRKRALLVGINEYQDPATSPLQGCVNDAWLMSAVLQESGFAADDIRMVLNQRATATALVERLQWLIDGARPGDTCVFYFSGHGAQLPVYGGDGQRVEAVHETLVPHDFDWSRGQAFSDQQFATLYSQLPDGLNFLGVFDCCHSGGLTRGGSQRVRGLNPPDDIRHRMLRWEPAMKMWVPRDFGRPGGSGHKAGGSRTPASTLRLGAAQTVDGAAGDARRLQAAAEYGHQGPYRPTLLYACKDAEFSYEYDHGPISHGAFTYCLVKRLRDARQGRRRQMPSFEKLMKQVSDELKLLGYAQTPQLVAPDHIRAMTVPLSA